MAGQDDTPKGQPQKPDYKGLLGQLEKSVADAVEAHSSPNGQLTTTEKSYIATVHNSATGNDDHVPTREIDFIGTTSDKIVTGKVLVANGDNQHPRVDLEVEYREPGKPQPLHAGDLDGDTNFGSASLIADVEVRNYLSIYTSTSIGPIVPVGYSWAPGDKAEKNERNAETRALPEVEAMGNEVKASAQSILPASPPKRSFKPVEP